MSIVYETSFERFQTLVFQDSNNDFLGTSDASYINGAWSVFLVLDQAVRGIQEKVHSQPLGGGAKKADYSVGASISWQLDHQNDDALQSPQHCILTAMSHVITIVIPPMLTNPVIVAAMEKLITLSIFNMPDDERQQNPIRPRAYEKYTAFFCLTTSEYSAEQHRRGPESARSLSNALMGRKSPLSGKHLSDIGRISSFASYPIGSAKSAHCEENKTVLERIKRHQREFGRCEQ